MNKVKMNKIELYNKIVEIYKKTGQGTPGFIKLSIGQDVIIDELIEDGLIKVVTQKFNYLPDDEKLCLTKGYCVEEEYIKDKSTRFLNYIRMYLNHDPVIEVGDIVVTLKQAFSNVDLVKGYAVWLEKNKAALDEMDAIEKLPETGLGLNEELIEYIKTRDWYKNNDIVSVCLSKMIESDDLVAEKIKLTTQLIELYKDPRMNGKYDDKKEESIKELAELKIKQKNRARIANWLETKDSNLKINDLIN